MKILSHIHAFAQVGRVLFVRSFTHFGCILSMYAIYPIQFTPKMCVMARLRACIVCINTGGFTRACT